MMHPKRDECDRFQLEKVFLETVDASEETKLATHLDRCAACRERLAEFAGDESFWTKATSNLSASTNLRSSPDPEMQSSVFVRIDPNAPHVAATTPASALDSETEHPFDPPKHPEILGSVEGFSIEQMIGRGGMGVVYKGFDAELNRPVAIKFLAPHLSVSGVARKRFAREAQAAAAVVHPNVVPIYSIGTSHNRPFLVMALVSGRSLQKHIEQNGPLPAEDIVRIAQQIAAGLSAAHEQGLVHRDIKPANIMLEKEVSRVLITDFGLARASDDAGLTQSGWLAGTPHYMSPEQTKGDDIGHSSDLFSLGSVMYFMSTGREPFRAENPYAVLQKIGTEMPASPRSINCAIPSTLNDLIAKLHEKNPEDRFRSAAAVQETLRQYLAHLQNPTQHPSPTIIRKKELQVRPSRKMAIGLAVVTALCVAVMTLPSILSPAQPLTTDPSTVLRNAPPTIERDTTPSWIANSAESQRWDAIISSLRESARRMEQPVATTEHSTDWFETNKARLRNRIQAMQQSFGM